MSLFNRNKKLWIIKPDDTKAEKKAIEKTRRITDQELLKEIYSTASTSKIRITALENMVLFIPIWMKERKTWNKREKN